MGGTESPISEDVASQDSASEVVLHGVALDSVMRDSAVVDVAVYVLRKGDRVKVSDDEERVVREGYVVKEKPLLVKIRGFKYGYHWDNVERIEIFPAIPTSLATSGLQEGLQRASSLG